MTTTENETAKQNTRKMKTLNGKYLPNTKGYIDIQFSNPEVLEEVKTYRVNRVCTKCYDGAMICGGFAHPTSPMSYQHTCTNCGNEEYYGKRYPSLEYK